MELYIQGNSDNQWLPAQKWQVEFLSQKTEILQKPSFVQKGTNPYIAIPVTNPDAIECKNLTSAFKQSGVSKIAYYNPSWFSYFGFSSGTEDHKPAGFLCNLKTGTSRMYLWTDTPKDQLSKNFTFTGIQSLGQDTLMKYRSLMAIPDVEQFMSSPPKLCVTPAKTPPLMGNHYTDGLFGDNGMDAYVNPDKKFEIPKSDII